jgi:hypothetical protein
MRATAALLCATVALAATAAFPQRGGGPGGQQSGQASTAPEGQTAMAGAGTTNGSTTGVSGPDGGGGPRMPEASLCDSYQGEAHQYCLWTVLAPPEQGNTP